MIGGRSAIAGPPNRGFTDGDDHTAADNCNHCSDGGGRQPGARLREFLPAADCRRNRGAGANAVNDGGRLRQNGGRNAGRTVANARSRLPRVRRLPGRRQRQEPGARDRWRRFRRRAGDGRSQDDRVGGGGCPPATPSSGDAACERSADRRDACHIERYPPPLIRDCEPRGTRVFVRNRINSHDEIISTDLRAAPSPSRQDRPSGLRHDRVLRRSIAGAASAAVV